LRAQENATEMRLVPFMKIDARFGKRDRRASKRPADHNGFGVRRDRENDRAKRYAFLAARPPGMVVQGLIHDRVVDRHRLTKLQTRERLEALEKAALCSSAS
jgi:hypothetical protein